MTTIRIEPQGSYMVKLASVISDCNPGDTIIVNSNVQKELALRAIARVCPEKGVKIVVEAECSNE